MKNNPTSKKSTNGTRKPPAQDSRMPDPRVLLIVKDREKTEKALIEAAQSLRPIWPGITDDIMRRATEEAASIEEMREKRASKKDAEIEAAVQIARDLALRVLIRKCVEYSVNFSVGKEERRSDNTQIQRAARFLDVQIGSKSFVNNLSIYLHGLLEGERSKIVDWLAAPSEEYKKKELKEHTDIAGRLRKVNALQNTVALVILVSEKESGSRAEAVMLKEMASFVMGKSSENTSSLKVEHLHSAMDLEKGLESPMNWWNDLVRYAVDFKLILCAQEEVKRTTGLSEKAGRSGKAKFEEEIQAQDEAEQEEFEKDQGSSEGNSQQSRYYDPKIKGLARICGCLGIRYKYVLPPDFIATLRSLGNVWDFWEMSILPDLLVTKSEDLLSYNPLKGSPLTYVTRVFRNELNTGGRQRMMEHLGPQYKTSILQELYCSAHRIDIASIKNKEELNFAIRKMLADDSFVEELSAFLTQRTKDYLERAIDKKTTKPLEQTSGFEREMLDIWNDLVKSFGDCPAWDGQEYRFFVYEARLRYFFVAGIASLWGHQYGATRRSLNALKR